jgi:hypothetical protein
MVSLVFYFQRYGLKNMHMNIDLIFQENLNIWNDCNFGYVVCENTYGSSEPEAIAECWRECQYFNFYPLHEFNHKLVFPDQGLIEVGRVEFGNLFLQMATRAIVNGSDMRLDVADLLNLLGSFLDEVIEPRFYSNFRDNSWAAVTTHSRDSLICAVGLNKIGMWLSYDDD